MIVNERNARRLVASPPELQAMEDYMDLIRAQRKAERERGVRGWTSAARRLHDWANMKDLMEEIKCQ